MSKNKPLVFLDVSIDGDPFERMIFELFTDVAPKTAENFRLLCTGEKGESPKTGRPLHYKGTFFHRIIKGSMAKDTGLMAGDLLRREGNYGESIYGEKFPDESPKLKHDGPGLLSMAIADRDERGSLFIVTFKADYHLDRKCVVFGKLVLGNEVLKKIENVGDEDGRPSVTVKIINCGELDRRKLHKLKLGKDASPQANSHEVRRKGKHKKSSKERRKKRRHYTSESSSSSDDETESSESDSDSDSYESSSTEVSSSSDDRRRKRKRSKRDKHRRGKKDSRREKRRKQHDKKSKRKSKRASDNLSGRDSESEGGPKGNAGEAQGLEMTPKNLERNHSPSVEEGKAASVWEKRGEPTDMFEREDGEFPKDNGEPQSNGIGVENRSQRSADKQPDIVDDHPDKSRSRSISPKRSLSKSMSISPKRSPSRSRSVSPKQSMSRSRSVSGSPQRQLLRSRSTSPVRSASSRSPSRNVSRSPTRGKKGRSVSASPPVRGRTQKSSSRSPSASPPRRPTRSPPRASARRSSRKSASRSPARSSRRGVSRSPVQPRRSLSRSPVRLSRRSVSRSSGRAPSRRSPSRSSGRAPSRNNRRSYSRSPRNGSRMVRSPISDRGRSSSRSPSVEASPQRVRRGRGFSERYSYVRRYRSRSPDRSPVRSYRYGGGRVDRDRYPSYRRSPRRYRSPPRGRTPTRYRGRRSRSRSRSLSHSPIRYRRRYSRSPVRSRSPVDRHRGSPRAERRRSPSKSGSPSESRSSLDSQSPKQVSKEKSRSSSGSPPGRTGLVSYGDGSPDSGRD